MPVDRGVEEVIATHKTAIAVLARSSAGLRVAVAHAAPLHPPATAGRDLADFLDVDVDQVSDSLGYDAPDDAARRADQPAQSGDPVAGQHSVHGRGMNAQQITDPGWSPTAQYPDLDDAALGTGGRLAGASVRSRAPIGHAGLAVLSVSRGPALGRGDRDLEAFGRSSQRPAVL